MTEFISEIKCVPHSDIDIFRALSDMSKLELVKDKIPETKIKSFEFDKDSCSFRVEPIGFVRFDIVERQPNKLIKLQSENLPFESTLWIQLAPKDEKETKMKITVRSDVSPLIKSMISKPMQEAVDKVADALARLPYDEI